jgi:hypothetical protein
MVHSYSPQIDPDLNPDWIRRPAYFYGMPDEYIKTNEDRLSYDIVHTKRQMAGMSLYLELERRFERQPKHRFISYEKKKCFTTKTAHLPAETLLSLVYLLDAVDVSDEAMFLNPDYTVTIDYHHMSQYELHIVQLFFSRIVK